VFRRLTLALIAAASVLFESRDVVAVEARFPSRDVLVRVTLESNGHASVSQEYGLIDGIADAAFEFLADSCTEISKMSATADDRPVAVAPAEDRRGPWTTLRFNGTSAARTWRISYEVTTHGTAAAIPIVMPASSLENESGRRGARVSMNVQWTGAPGAASVLIPRLVAQSVNGWNATLLAMPSTVRVSLPAGAGAGSCRYDDTGYASGLEWRFGVFVLTMAVWMAAYLAWFGRPWAARN
jgi:hypothetical protein